jgi:NAD(P) transhydrogenase
MAPAFDYDLVCIGSGPAGQRAAVQAAKLGKRVAVVEKQLCVSGVCIETGAARFREIARGQILGDDSGLFKMIFRRDDGRLLGAHCIGTQATELIHIGQAVLALGGGLDYFLKTVFNYPTLAECYKVAAFNAANKLQYARSAAITAPS